jgi:hypothetical protein
MLTCLSLPPFCWQEARNDGLAQGLAFTLASWAPSLRSLSLGVDLLHHILPRHLLVSGSRTPGTSSSCVQAAGLPWLGVRLPGPMCSKHEFGFSSRLQVVRVSHACHTA